MGADLELLAALLVDVGRAVDRPRVLDGGQRDRPRHLCARAAGGVDDLGGGLIQDPVVVGLQPDSDFLVKHHDRCSSTSAATINSATFLRLSGDVVVSFGGNASRYPRGAG